MDWEGYEWIRARCSCLERLGANRDGLARNGATRSDFDRVAAGFSELESFRAGSIRWSRFQGIGAN